MRERPMRRPDRTEHVPVEGTAMGMPDQLPCGTQGSYQETMITDYLKHVRLEVTEAMVTSLVGHRVPSPQREAERHEYQHAWGNGPMLPIWLVTGQNEQDEAQASWLLQQC